MRPASCVSVKYSPRICKLPSASVLICELWAPIQLVCELRTVSLGVLTGPSRTSEMELLSNIVNGFQPLIIWAKISILDVRLGFEYASGVINQSVSREFALFQVRI